MEHTFTNRSLTNPLSLFSTSQTVLSLHLITFTTRVMHVGSEHETTAENIRVSHCWRIFTRDSYNKDKKRRGIREWFCAKNQIKDKI